MNPLGAAWSCWAIVGLSPIIGRYAAPVIHPVLLVVLGTLLACGCFAPWLTQKAQWCALFAKENRLPFLFIGTFGTALSFSVLLWALHYTTPANAAILQQSELLYSLLFAFLFLKEIPTKRQLAASFLILAGSVLILLKEQYSARWVGDCLIVGSTWMLQAASCVAKKLSARLDPRLIAAARNFYALPALLILLIACAVGGDLYLKNGFATVGIVFYTGILKYTLAMLLWYYAIHKLDLAKVTAIYLSYPLLSFALSALLGLERVHLYQLIGLAFTLAGAYWLSAMIKQQQEKI